MGAFHCSECHQTFHAEEDLDLHMREVHRGYLVEDSMPDIPLEIESMVGTVIDGVAESITSVVDADTFGGGGGFSGGGEGGEF